MGVWGDAANQKAISRGIIEHHVLMLALHPNQYKNSGNAEEPWAVDPVSISCLGSLKPGTLSTCCPHVRQPLGASTR